MISRNRISEVTRNPTQTGSLKKAFPGGGRVTQFPGDSAPQCAVVRVSTAIPGEVVDRPREPAQLRKLRWGVRGRSPHAGDAGR